jgi:ABC transporter substrate binding protein (PQQ-dependent alcohol dehydrogenase system)
MHVAQKARFCKGISGVIGPDSTSAAGTAGPKVTSAIRRAIGTLMIVICAGPCFAAQQSEIRIGYLHTLLAKNKISLIDLPAADEGLAGAQLAIDDNTTTGQFLGQHFALIEMVSGDDPAAAIRSFAERGIAIIVTAIGGNDLLIAADAAKSIGPLLLVNALAQDDSLREQNCRPNIIHVAPSRSMLTDALAQYLAAKRWRRWALVTGSHDADKLLGASLKRAASKFGAKIVGEREYEDTGGARRTDSGLAEVQRQIPLLTQGFGDYDVLVAADESEVFAGYLPYRTWDPRPVAGSAGLVPTTWNAAFDQWGAVQLQSRFARKFRRPMTPLDAQTWTAVRMIGEAATRKGTADATALAQFIKGPDFSVAAFKGQKLTIRPWNLQLRQPILLFDGHNTVSVSPQEGFLHPVSTLDTLGIDQPETKCKLDGGIGR